MLRCFQSPLHVLLLVSLHTHTQRYQLLSQIVLKRSRVKKVSSARSFSIKEKMHPKQDGKKKKF